MHNRVPVVSKPLNPQKTKGYQWKGNVHTSHLIPSGTLCDHWSGHSDALKTGPILDKNFLLQRVDGFPYYVEASMTEGKGIYFCDTLIRHGAYGTKDARSKVKAAGHDEKKRTDAFLMGISSRFSSASSRQYSSATLVGCTLLLWHGGTHIGSVPGTHSIFHPSQTRSQSNMFCVFSSLITFARDAALTKYKHIS